MKTQEPAIEAVAKRFGVDVEHARRATLKGLWRGLKISERDIKEAKESLSKSR